MDIETGFCKDFNKNLIQRVIIIITTTIFFLKI